jgi:hypothetical protein
MMRLECEFEPEVVAAVLQSRWPERADPELRAHVAGCAICSDVAAVAGIFEEARQESGIRAEVPESARVWWRAQLRARREAAEAAARPMIAAQVIALVCTAGLLVACFRNAAPQLQSALAWMAALGAEHGALVVAMATVLLVAPAALYLAIGRE